MKTKPVGIWDTVDGLTWYCARVAVSTFLIRMFVDGKDLVHLALYALIVLSIHILCKQDYFVTPSTI